MKHAERVARMAMVAAVGVLALVLAGAGSVHAQDGAAAEPDSAAAKAFDPWKPGSQWMSFRAGYAKSTVKGAGDGGAGFAFGYSRMISGLKLYKLTPFRHYSIGASVGYDVLGRFGPAAEIEVPFTLELTRHYRWSTPIHPYYGFGLGGFYRKTYRTGDDQRDANLGWFLAGGANTPIGGRNVVGFDVRFARVAAKNSPVNPVFGEGANRATHWSAKVGYSFAY